MSQTETEYLTTPTRVVPLLRRSEKLVIRWDSDKQRYTAQRPLFPITQRITVSRTRLSRLKQIDGETDVFNSQVPLDSNANTFLG